MNTDFYLHNNYISQTPKRSYVHWWNNYHIKNLKNVLKQEIILGSNDITSDKIIKNIRGFPSAFDNYWNEYYLPRSLTWFQDLFAYNMNSTRKYQVSKKFFTTISDFTSRKQSSLNNKIRDMLTKDNKCPTENFDESFKRKEANSGQRMKISNDANENLNLSLVYLTEIIEYQMNFEKQKEKVLQHRIPIIYNITDRNNPHLESNYIDKNYSTEESYVDKRNLANITNDLVTQNLEILNSRGYISKVTLDRNCYNQSIIDNITALDNYTDTKTIFDPMRDLDNAKLYKFFITEEEKPPMFF